MIGTLRLVLHVVTKDQDLQAPVIKALRWWWWLEFLAHLYKYNPSVDQFVPLGVTVSQYIFFLTPCYWDEKGSEVPVSLSLFRWKVVANGQDVFQGRLYRGAPEASRCPCALTVSLGWSKSSWPIIWENQMPAGCVLARHLQKCLRWVHMHLFRSGWIRDLFVSALHSYKDTASSFFSAVCSLALHQKKIYGILA